MNAAAKAINQNNFFNGQLLAMRLSKQFYFMLALLSILLMSGLSVVYVTNEHRIAFSQFQRLQQNTHQLQLQWGQLLLEQASLATPARIEQLAVEKFKMHHPLDKETFMLRDQ